jgi:diguanylate cyclase (GGDEF)-like protein/PAS domain S-box-containing protein
MQNLTAKSRRISIIAGVVLIIATLVTGFVVFTVMKNSAEALLSRGMLLSLQTRADQFRLEIQETDAAARHIADHPDVIGSLAALQRNPSAPRELAMLRRIAQSLLTDGTSRVEFFLAHDANPVAAAGERIDNEISVPLPLRPRGRLAWNNGFVLGTSVEVRKGTRLVGLVTVYSRHPALDAFLTAKIGLGKTGEIAICSPLPDDHLYMKCFPTQISGHVFPHQARIINGAPLPMSHALNGKTGVVVAHDYRQKRVVAAYGPIGHLGLGMVLKIDTSELFAPVWREARYILIVVLLIVAIGVALLRWLVTPLISQVLMSEKEAHDANALLRDTETRTRAVLENVDEGIITLSDSGHIESANSAVESMFGYDGQSLRGKSIGLLLRHHDQDLDSRLYLQQLLAADSVEGHFGQEVTGRRTDGSTFPVGLKISDMELGDRTVYIGALRDLTDLKAKEEKILHLANHDALTGLPNRNLLQDRIQQAINHGYRHGTRVAVLFLDLDNFKTINDSLGHDVGDMLLEAVATRIQECVREKDTVARQGGDEFIVVVTELGDAQDSGVVAANVLQRISQPYSIGNRELHVNASVGIAVFPEDGKDVETLLKNSDIAMYHAKSAGRDTFQFYAPEMNRVATERLVIETNLRHAIEEDQLRVAYQPILAADGNMTVAAETLLRWDHPTLGSVSPSTFVPVAEESGVIVSLGEWVMRQACMQYRAWKDDGFNLQRVVVNVSPRQFRQRNLAQSFVDILHETGVKARCVGLEITENVIMDNPEFAIETLKELREFGFEISLDDFGMGYSSLSMLKRFPIDKLKVDRSFIRDLETDEADASLIAGIIAMAHNLGIRVVAEGVETEGQLAFVLRHECDEYQGYLFGRPASADEFSAKWLGCRDERMGLAGKDSSLP